MSLPKPEFDGTTHGQCRSIEVRVATGKRFPWTPPGRSEPIWLAVMESRMRIDWVWDNDRKEWLSEQAWAVRYPAPNAGRVTVSKHDFGPLASLKKRLAENKRRANIADKRARRKSNKKSRKGGR